MSKTLLPLVAMSGLILAACNDRVHQIDREPLTAQVSVHVSNFSVTMEDFPSTRAMQDVSEYTSAKQIILAFHAPDGTLVNQMVQTRSDQSTYTTFGDFSCTLPLGTYTVTAIALGMGFTTNDIFTLTSPTQAGFETDRARETFAASGEIVLDDAHGYELQLELDRIVAMLTVISTDGRPADITQIRTTYSAGSKSFNPSTGLATDSNGFSLINNPSTAVGDTIMISSFTFLTSQEQPMDITLETIDTEGNTVSTYTIPDVPLQQNHKTILRGPLFSAPVSTPSFQLDAEWLNTIRVNF